MDDRTGTSQLTAIRLVGHCFDLRIVSLTLDSGTVERQYTGVTLLSCLPDHLEIQKCMVMKRAQYPRSRCVANLFPFKKRHAHFGRPRHERASRENPADYNFFHLILRPAGRKI